MGQVLATNNVPFDLREDIKRPFENTKIVVDYLTTGQNTTYSAERCINFTKCFAFLNAIFNRVVGKVPILTGFVRNTKSKC